MPRAFAAIALPAAAREAMTGYLARCSAAAPGFRWVEAGGLHMTLRFMGSIDEEAIERVKRELAAVRAPAFEARAGGLGSFGSAGRASIVFMGLQAGQAAASALAMECEEACRRAGLPPDERPFRPHVTLARARRRGGDPPPRVPPPPDLGAWRVLDLVLFESRLAGGRPPVYLPLATFPLTG